MQGKEYKPNYEILLQTVFNSVILVTKTAVANRHLLIAEEVSVKVMHVLQK